MERETLIHLVTAAQSGDGDALEKLLSAFYKDVFYFALKTVKDEELAADITQETFATVITTIEDLKEPAAFVKWMKQITYHHCTHYFSKKKEVLVDEDEEGNTVFDVVAEDRTEFIPDEALDQQDFRKTILSILDELPEEQRAAVLMYYYDELSIKQIAEIQGVSEGTVKSRLNYARKAVKNSVETYEKKHNIRLHTFAFLPFMFWLFKKDAEESASAANAAAPAVAEGVSATTGTQLSLGGAVAGSAGAVTAAATISGTGLLGKLASTPLVVKILAGIAAAVVVLGGLGILLHNGDSADQPTVPSTSASQPASSAEHTHSYEEQVVSPSCTEQGYTVHLCSCGDSYEDNFVAAMGHDYISAVIAPTTEEQGYTRYECIYCDDTYNAEFVDKLPAEPTSIEGVVPEGCTYILADGTELVAGDSIPEGSQVDDQVITPNYIYTCIDRNGYPQNAWKAEARSKSQESYPALLAEINGSPLISLYGAFKDCDQLKDAPIIPESVVDMTSTFSGCSKLKEAPIIPGSVEVMMNTFKDCTSMERASTIPESVRDLRWTFSGCTSLTGTIEIHATPTTVSLYTQGCFRDTVLPITLTGASDVLETLKATATNGNVSIDSTNTP